MTEQTKELAGLAQKVTLATTEFFKTGILCVPNIRFSMDAENRRGKFVTQ
jgi:hypothetical protein